MKFKINYKNISKTKKKYIFFTKNTGVNGIKNINFSRRYFKHTNAFYDHKPSNNEGNSETE